MKKDKLRLIEGKSCPILHRTNAFEFNLTGEVNDARRGCSTLSTIDIVYESGSTTHNGRRLELLSSCGGKAKGTGIGVVD
jgi:hypothetical protein